MDKIESVFCDFSLNSKLRSHTYIFTIRTRPGGTYTSAACWSYKYFITSSIARTSRIYPISPWVYPKCRLYPDGSLVSQVSLILKGLYGWINKTHGAMIQISLISSCSLSYWRETKWNMKSVKKIYSDFLITVFS